jgi:pyridoxal phosphate enzyme (YggS family)
MILPYIDLLHSLSSERLADEIEKQAMKTGIIIPALVEVNSGKEENKGGFLPEEVENFLKKKDNYPHIKIVGMMTMGPIDESGERIRECFNNTKSLFDKAAADGKFDTDSPILSMGMSDSYVAAIECGANLVRIGRAIFDKGDYINV